MNKYSSKIFACSSELSRILSHIIELHWFELSCLHFNCTEFCQICLNWIEFNCIEWVGSNHSCHLIWTSDHHLNLIPPTYFSSAQWHGIIQFSKCTLLDCRGGDSNSGLQKEEQQLRAEVSSTAWYHLQGAIMTYHAIKCQLLFAVRCDYLIIILLI